MALTRRPPPTLQKSSLDGLRDGSALPSNLAKAHNS